MAKTIAPFAAVGVVLVVTVVLAACGGGQSLKIKGSDTVLPIAQKFAETYGAVNPQAEISVTGGGSGVGIAALLENTTDIAMSSREIKLSEKLRLQNKQLAYAAPVIAYDALAACVHPSNPVTQLTREQLESIYTGRVKNWKDVGGEDLQIVVYSRESSSGTHEFFKEKVMSRNEFAPDVLMMPATGAIIQSVSQTRGAIGYVGLAYLNGEVKALGVSYDKGKSFVQPTAVNAIKRTYPIVRPLYFIYLNEKADKLKNFMDFALGKEGQLEIKKLGFIPIQEELVTDTQQPKQAHAR
jgi:phosphate transport system substrate-binding protein